MPRRQRVIYTVHATKMLSERTIAPSWVEQTLLDPDSVEPDPRHADSKRAFRRIPERDGRVLRVVYGATDGTLRVVTLFLDRGRRQ